MSALSLACFQVHFFRAECPKVELGYGFASDPLKSRRSQRYYTKPDYYYFYYWNRELRHPCWI